LKNAEGLFSVPKMDSKQVACELFLAYKAIKKEHRTENTRFVGRKAQEKLTSRAKVSSQLYKKHEDYNERIVSVCKGCSN
jgi:hypothetical protein